MVWGEAIESELRSTSLTKLSTKASLLRWQTGGIFTLFEDDIDEDCLGLFKPIVGECFKSSRFSEETDMCGLASKNNQDTLVIYRLRDQKMKLKLGHNWHKGGGL
eukprot:14526818-Ditylum_brightwellii.AAC.2